MTNTDADDLIVRLARLFYRIGPLLFVPLILVGASFYLASPEVESGVAKPIIYLLPLAVFWHCALIITELPKLRFVWFAVINLALYVFIGFYCIVITSYI